MARYRNVTIWTRVQVLSGLNIVLEVPGGDPILYGPRYGVIVISALHHVHKGQVRVRHNHSLASTKLASTVTLLAGMVKMYLVLLFLVSFTVSPLLSVTVSSSSS